MIFKGLDRQNLNFNHFFSGDKRRALYEFTSVNDDELDFELGDIIEVSSVFTDHHFEAGGD